jgi:hypothetical protein
MTAADRIAAIGTRFPEEGFFQDKEWVLSPQAFPLAEEVVATLEALGPALRRFQRVCNDLYFAGAAGGEHAWVTQLMDLGKPPALVTLGRRQGWQADLPGVIRPDLLLTEQGVSIAELDSLPGGIGLTAWLNETYAALGEPVLGGAAGVVEAFRAAFPSENFLVSQEAADYQPEMRWLAERLGDGRQVLNPWSIDPAALAGQRVYRFFELFDLDQVEHSERLLAMAAAGELTFTPPLKPFLEEKLWLALFWAPRLQDYWERHLSAEEMALLRQCIPQGWVVDPTPLPPSGEITGLGAADWQEVMGFGRRERELVLKISGFSELGWGSRGVFIGHDLSPAAWQGALERALAGFATHPHLLQRFHQAKLVEHPAWDAASGVTRLVPSRVRLCPYYFATGAADEVTLGGVLATVCPADKKLLHGMRDAMMLPCGPR